MGRLGTSLLGALAAAALLLAAATSDAACGDGALDAGEACDASATGGDAACPGACVPATFADGCTCAAPSLDPRQYVIVATSHLRIGSDAAIFSGNIAASGASATLVVGRSAILPSVAQATGSFGKVLGGAKLGRLFANGGTVRSDATVANGGPFHFAAPLTILDTLPPFPIIAPGAAPISVGSGTTLVLAPGAYDAVSVGESGTLVLHGFSDGSGAGLYDLGSLRLGFAARLVADNPVVVNVAGRLTAGPQSSLGPSGRSGLIAGDVQVNAAGRSVSLGRGAIVSAHVRLAKGTIRVGRAALVSGRLIGDSVGVTHATVTREGACGDGLLDPGEACDASAPGGDAACPGQCIPGDPQGSGRIAFGSRGQCTCTCHADADCDDGNACNGAETCVDGACVLGIAPDCEDHNPCTRDCDPAVGCMHTALDDGTSCSDGNSCTTGDTCQGGTCHAGTPVTDGTACSDGDACTIADVCSAGTCVAGPARDCSDDNSCTADACDASAGCTHTFLAEGTPCTGDACTVNATCRSHTCVGSARNCDDGNPCTADSCDPNLGCQHTALPDGDPCGAGTCRGGLCQ